MTDSELQAQIAAATAYEKTLVPGMLAEWADPVMDGSRIVSRQRVLDVGCGTGSLARAASRRVGLNGWVAGVDPNPGMLAVAGGIDWAIEWREGTAEALPFPDESFDAVVSQFAMTSFVDPVDAVVDMMRVLRPGGRFAVAVWDSLDQMPVRAAIADLFEDILGDRAAGALRAEHSLGDEGELTRIFIEGGVQGPTVGTRTGSARFVGIRALIESELRGALPLRGIEVSEPRIEEALSRAEQELASFARPNGEIAFETRAHIVVGGQPLTASAPPRSPGP